jgi:heme-degrading monooxygenase HmoA
VACARVSTYTIPEGRLDEATVAFSEAAERVRGLQGLTEVYVMIDRERSHALTVTVWESVAAMEASRIAATRVRSEAARTVEGDVESVREYEVTLQETGHGPGHSAPITTPYESA